MPSLKLWWQIWKICLEFFGGPPGQNALTHVLTTGYTTQKSKKTLQIGLTFGRYIGIMTHMKATQYSLKNPYTGDELVRCDASELTSFLSYFRGLIGVWDIPFEVL